MTMLRRSELGWDRPRTYVSVGSSRPAVHRAWPRSRWARQNRWERVRSRPRSNAMQPDRSVNRSPGSFAEIVRCLAALVRNQARAGDRLASSSASPDPNQNLPGSRACGRGGQPRIGQTGHPERGCPRAVGNHRPDARGLWRRARGCPWPVGVHRPQGLHGIRVRAAETTRAQAGDCDGRSCSRTTSQSPTTPIAITMTCDATASADHQRASWHIAAQDRLCLTRYRRHSARYCQFCIHLLSGRSGLHSVCESVGGWRNFDDSYQSTRRAQTMASKICVVEALTRTNAGVGHAA
jgi:hypothetical protein